ncbi:peptide chain release factor N(5)-glutamine methyltransferase [Nibribacter ruber]|uniref:Release factor glutamine methyltransferase n=1 Tax=Nibribacter ruber TaxID=2698458 RepID=A0A6P1NXB0_9BACT|nr:peptide chain release factor N(5)-glutamine methyltransferase [Nibribacter ruber]QHL88317.1 peptide chain release factor N(5)-glutamine methyltransferase [Nibribacter ruber]
MTIQNLLQTLTAQLETVYDANEARTITEWVLQHELKCSRFELLQQRLSEASAKLQDQVDGFLPRLLAQEPVQYVLGEASFYGREFLVSPAVLIPRSETEELVQMVIQEYKRHAEVKLLDIGTGSGCIPITLSLELPHAIVWGLDVSTEALTIARQNGLELAARVQWLHQDILQEVPAIAPASLDAVVSNPPYVLEEEKGLMRDNVLSFEPHLALFVPDHDPLLFYRRIADLALNQLKPQGKLFFEINERYAQETAAMLREWGYKMIEIKKDLRGKDRFVTASFV